MLRGIIISAAAFAAVASAQVFTPGTPCIDVTGRNSPCVGSTPSGISSLADPVFNLTNDPGTTNLGIFVIPGDVVLFETANGSLPNPGSWSDVLEFSNTANGSTATIFPDVEGFGIVLPPGFTLSANALGVRENPNGVGSDADFTTYTAGSATYLVHSDSPAFEPPEPMEGTPEPSTMALLGLGMTGVFLARRGRAR